MRYLTNRILLTLTLISTLISAATYAQDNNPRESRQVTGLEEIVVTVRKREESSQEIPISLLVATADDLRNRGVQQFGDLQQSMPTLSVTQAAVSSSSVNVAMRGNVLVDIRLNTDPVVGVYLDGVYLPRSQGLSTGDFYDIERVEVLAGPQSTLYGKNTSGGAINIFTKTPVDTFEGSVRLGYGEHDTRQVAAMINIPVNDTLSTRLVTNMRGRDGFGTNFYNGDDTGELDSQNWRGTALWTPSDALEITFRADYTNSKSTGNAYKGMSYVNPVGLAALSASFETGLTPAQAAAYLESFAKGNKDDGNMNQPVAEQFRSWGLSTTIDWQLSENTSLKSITAWRKFTKDGTADLDGTPVAILDYPKIYTTDKQISQEFQLLGTAFDDRLDWVTGIYYSEELGDEEIHQLAVGALSGGIPGVQLAEDVGADSLGIFAQGTYALTESLRTTVGMRYTEDKRTMDQRNWNATHCLSTGQTLASIGGTANCVRPMKVSFDKVTYTAGLEYQPWQDRDLMFYAKTSRGYRSGGLQQLAGSPLPLVADVANQPFDSETVDDIEVGIKAVWLDNRMITNLTFFQSEIEDIIRNVSSPIPGTTVLASNAQNAAKASVDGVEWLVRYLPVAGLELSYAGAYYDAGYDEYITPTGEDRSDLDLLFTPEWRHALSASYTQDTSYGEWRAQLDWLYTSKQLATEKVGYQPSHKNLNGRFSIFLQEYNMELAVYGKNLSDERYVVFPVDALATLGFIYDGGYNAPRTIGVEMNFNF